MDFSEDLQQMRAWLGSERGSRPSGYMNVAKYFAAYSVFHFPLHLPEVPWILGQYKAHVGGQPAAPQHIVDLGCGPGTASLGAIFWLLENELPLPKKVTLFDLSQKALDTAARLLLTLAPELEIEKIRGQLFSKKDRQRIREPGDWILVSYVLNEVGSGPRFRDKKIQLTRDIAEQHTRDENSWILIVEPPLREPTLDLMNLRDQIQDEMQVLAPCPPGARLCPMTLHKLGWCYAQPPRTMARAQGLAPWDQELELAANIELTEPGFSYMLLRPHFSGEKNLRGGKARSHSIALTDSTRTLALLCQGNDIGKQNVPSPFRGAYLPQTFKGAWVAKPWGSSKP